MGKYITLFWGILFFVFGVSFMMTNGASQDDATAKIKDYERLVKMPVKAMALMDSTVNVTTVKVMKVPIKTYTCNYYFEVNGTRYASKYSSATEPSKLLMEVSYLAENPAINAFDPGVELASLKEQTSSNMLLYVGSVLALIGAFRIYSFVQTRRAEKQAAEDEFQQQLAADNERMLKSLGQPGQ